MNDLQNKILDIFKEIKKVLDRNNITYFALGGTAVGAIRHNGFIPWDDDLDILIPNNEFNKFIECCKKELPENLEIFNPNNSKHAIVYFYKIHDKNTAYLEQATYKYKDYRFGVFVDIMPFYGLPELDQIDKYNKICTIYRVLDEARRCELSQLASKQKVITVLLKPINVLLPINYWRDKLCKYQSKYTFDKSNYVGLAYKSLNKKFIYKKEWFDDFVDIKFEDTTIRCCKEYDKYLKTHFGNYIELPPVEERASHHNLEVIDLNHSYNDYDESLNLKNGNE